MDIFSKQGNQRPEDEQAKRHLQKNWGTIEKLADTLSGGKYSADKVKKSPPQASGVTFVDHAPRRKPDVPDPYVRISTNGRVVIADSNTSRQLHFLGQLKRIDGEVRLVLATSENGFLSPLDPDIRDRLGDLADRVINRAYSEKNLASDIKERLGIA